MTSVLILTNCCKPRGYLTSLFTSKLRNEITQIRTSCTLKSLFKMHEAYLWYEKGNETFNFTFRYIQQELNIDRQFNLSRRVSENVETFLKRLDVNMGKVLDKKKRKKLKKNCEYLVEQRDNVGEGRIMLLKGENKIELELPCARIIEDPRDLFLLIFDDKYIIKFNPPWVNELELPACILAGFPIYASTFDAMYTVKSLSKFSWYKSAIESNDNKKNRKTWEKIGEGFIHVPNNYDIGCRIKLSCVPCNESQEGPEVQIEGKSMVQAGPGECPFEIRHRFTENKLFGNDFRILSYNILADTYADSDYTRQVLFPYCPPYALAIDYRKLLIVKELIGYNSDIICLQEVDKKIYENDLVFALSSLNYNGIFSTKGDTGEGLAVFYDKNRFQLLDNKCTTMGKSIELNESFNKIWTNIKNDNAKQRFLERNTSVLIVILQSKDNPTEILVIGNTHLYSHADADHIRLLQGYFALTECQNTVEYTKKLHPDKNVTLILSGDFNSTPGDGIYELMTNKYVSEDHVNWKSNAEQIIDNISLSHEMPLASACGTPKYTNFTVDFADCLDYIFYQTDKLQVTHIVPMPSKEELSAHQAIPSIVFPSDHVAICADLKWTL